MPPRPPTAVSECCRGLADEAVSCHLFRTGERNSFLLVSCVSSVVAGRGCLALADDSHRSFSARPRCPPTSDDHDPVPECSFERFGRYSRRCVSCRRCNGYAGGARPSSTVRVPQAAAGTAAEANPSRGRGPTLGSAGAEIQRIRDFFVIGHGSASAPGTVTLSG
jgi:hypothetical protein